MDPTSMNPLASGNTTDPRPLNRVKATTPQDSATNTAP